MLLPPFPPPLDPPIPLDPPPLPLHDLELDIQHATEDLSSKEVCARPPTLVLDDMPHAAIELEPDVEIWHLLCEVAAERRFPVAVARRFQSIDDGLVLRPLIVRSEYGFAEKGGRRFAELEGDGDRIHGGVQLAAGVRCVFVEDDVAALLGVHARQALHEVADFLPLVVVAFKEVGAVLDRDDDGAAVADFGLGGECEEDARCERYDRGYGRLGRGFVFVMAERATVEDAVGALVFGYGGAAEVNGRFGSACGELRSVLVQIIQVVLRLWSAQPMRVSIAG